MRRLSPAAFCLAMIAAVVCYCTPPARAAAEHLHISDRTVERQERLISDPAWSPRAHLGKTSGGAVFCGLANPDGSIKLWQLGQEIEQDRKINVTATRLTGLSRNGQDLWVATRDGLYRVAGEATEPLKQVLHLFVSTIGPPGNSPPTYHTSDDTECIGVAVASEMPWVALGPLGVETYIPAAGADDADEAEWHSPFLLHIGRSDTVITADPVTGVWLFAPPRQREPDEVWGLVHLDVQETGEQPEIAVLPDTPPQDTIPDLHRPSIAVAESTGVLVAGEMAQGNVFLRLKDGVAHTSVIPPDVIGARHVTAMTVDAAGRVYCGTDGAGVIVFEGDTWSVHPVTAYLPPFYDTGLKPVDDILISDDGVLYVASQRIVIRWWPDGQ